jgi:hypothetical protein
MQSLIFFLLAFSGSMKESSFDLWKDAALLFVDYYRDRTILFPEKSGASPVSEMM